MPPQDDSTRLVAVGRPSQYLGNEINIIRKNPASAELSIALAFPDIYEVGMSHLGLKILYQILNERPWLSAERVFSPWVDMETYLRGRRLPLTTLESRRPLSEFDIVGFSIQHELCYTNILNMLDLASIPFRAARRPPEAPLIIAGGPACFNPEPIAEFFDLMVIGDGEDVTPAICEIVRDWKRSGSKAKEGLLKRLSRLEGIYVPDLFRPRYDAGGRIESIEPLDPAYPFVRKATLPSIEKAPYPEAQLVPYTELIHDRLAVEISRGCTRGCRFCQAGMIYRPVRERNPETVARVVQKALAATGYDDLSLLSLSTGDYSCIEQLLVHLMDRHGEDRVAISLPSLRVDSLSPMFLDQIKRVRKTGFTLAVEAGSERLRRVINKGLTNEDILKMSHMIYGAGWNLIKLYCMIGLPLETDSDLNDTISLARDIAAVGARKSKRNNLNLSVSTFVPKAHTPFMWVPQIEFEESHRRLSLLREGLKRSPVKVKWNQPELSWLEGVFARGDRRLSSAVEAAWRAGARFDAWTEHFHRDLWQQAFGKTGIDPHFFVHRARDLDEVLPWDHIHSGVKKSFLKNEWERALRARLTHDCRHGCLECGVCDHSRIDPVLIGTWTPPPPPTQERAPEGEPASWLLTFTKLGEAALLGHLDLNRLFLRAFKRAGLRLHYSSGFHPLPKIAFSTALPLGMESLRETMVVELPEDIDAPDLVHKLTCQLPQGMEILSAEKMPANTRPPQLIRSSYTIRYVGVILDRQKLDRFLACRDFSVVKKTKKGEHVLNLRPLVDSLAFDGPGQLHLVLRHQEGPQMRPPEILKAVFALEDADLERVHVRKTDQVTI